MKKTFIYLVLTAAVLAVSALTVSCVRELDIQKPQFSDHASIQLTPVCDGPMTKADPQPVNGDDTYHENLISNYYWFIYSDQAGTTLKLSGYVDSDASQTIDLDEAFPNGGTGYVYVVANLPTDVFTFANGGIKNIASGAVAKTLSELKAISFGKPTPVDNNQSIVAGRSEFYNYTSATTGVPDPERFVMRTASPQPFTLVEKQIVDVTAELKRVAAKIIVNLKVAKDIRQTRTHENGEEYYVMTWFPELEHLQVYMLWGSTQGNLAANKITYGADNAHWFYSASPRYMMYSNNGGVYNPNTKEVEGSVPASSYGQTTSSIRTSVWEIVYQVRQDANNNPIWIWKDSTPASDRIDANIGDKAYGDWDYVLVDGQKQPVYNADGTVQRHLTTQTVNRDYWTITTKPLYSMPITWDINDPHAPFIKIVLPWYGKKYSNNGSGNEVLDEVASTPYYYKILLPNITALDDNRCYQIDLDLAVLGSEADDVPVEVTGQYHVVGWNPPMDMGGDQIAGRYLDCATSFEFYSQSEMNITVRSSHDIEIVKTGEHQPTAVYKNYSSTTSPVPELSLTFDENNSDGEYYSIKAIGNNKAVLSHSFVTVIEEMTPHDVAPITYTFRIQHNDNENYYKDITVVQYPALFIDNYLNSNYERGSSSYNSNRGYVYINGTTRPSMYNNPNVTTDWYYWSGTSSYSYATGNNNPNMYVITTKVIDPTLGYTLGDPRTRSVSVPTGVSGVTFTLAPAIGESTNRRLTYYYPTEASSQTENMIAPSFRMASSYGKCGYGFDLDHAVARCAAYQEDGYPAGRWRVPTKAEIEYVTTLSANHKIPQLFNTTADQGVGSVYWSAQGAIQVNSSGKVTSVDDTYAFVRCVYDDWYWGSEPPLGRSATSFTWGDKQR